MDSKERRLARSIVDPPGSGRAAGGAPWRPAADTTIAIVPGRPDVSREYRRRLAAIRPRVERLGVVGQDAESLAHDLIVKCALSAMRRDGRGPTALEIRHAVVDWKRAEKRRGVAQATAADQDATSEVRVVDPLVRSLELIALRAIADSLRAVQRVVPAVSRAAFALNVYGVSGRSLADDSEDSATSWKRRICDVRARVRRELVRRRVDLESIVALPGSLYLLRRALVRWARQWEGLGRVGRSRGSDATRVEANSEARVTEAR